MYQQIFNRPEYRDLRRSLRKNMTEAEQMLWQSLRRDQLGVRFRRQHGIGRYIADFYCRQARLVIEVDGAIHERDAVKANDREKDEYIRALGLRIIRFTNGEIQDSLSRVIGLIRAEVSKTPFQEWKGVDSRIP